jgi:AraC-like DNA-binding protein
VQGLLHGGGSSIRPGIARAGARGCGGGGKAIIPRPARGVVNVSAILRGEPAARAATEPVGASSYREWAPRAGLADRVACLWWRELAPGAAGDGHLVIPDACMDLIAYSDGRVIVAGPDTRPSAGGLPAGGAAVGIRFRPGAASAFLGVPASELRDLRVPLDDIAPRLGDRLAQRVAGSPAVDHAGLMLDAVAGSWRDEPDPLVRELVAALDAGPPRGLPEIAARLGTTERTLRRRADAALGYGPRTLARILRLQRAIALGRDRDLPLAAIAAAAGYADQPHMSREVRRMTGRSPGSLLA